MVTKNRTTPLRRSQGTPLAFRSHSSFLDAADDATHIGRFYLQALDAAYAEAIRRQPRNPDGAHREATVGAIRWLAAFAQGTLAALAPDKPERREATG